MWQSRMSRDAGSSDKWVSLPPPLDLAAPRASRQDFRCTDLTRRSSACKEQELKIVLKFNVLNLTNDSKHLICSLLSGTALTKGTVDGRQDMTEALTHSL